MRSKTQQEDGNEEASYQERSDDALVADELVGHVYAGKGRGEEADGDEQEEDLHGEMRLLGRLRGLGEGGLLVGLGGIEFGARFPDGDRGGLLLVELRERDDPGGRLVVAATRGLVKAESLEGSGEREEEDRWRDEDAGIEMDLASDFQDLVGRVHRDSDRF